MRGRGHLPPDMHVEGNAGRIAAPCTPATAPATVAGRTAVAKVARARDCYASGRLRNPEVQKIHRVLEGVLARNIAHRARATSTSMPPNPPRCLHRTEEAQ